MTLGLNPELRPLPEVGMLGPQLPTTTPAISSCPPRASTGERPKTTIAIFRAELYINTVWWSCIADKLLMSIKEQSVSKYMYKQFNAHAYRSRALTQNSSAPPWALWLILLWSHSCRNSRSWSRHPGIRGSHSCGAEVHGVVGIVERRIPSVWIVGVQWGCR